MIHLVYLQLNYLKSSFGLRPRKKKPQFSGVDGNQITFSLGTVTQKTLPAADALKPEDGDSDNFEEHEKYVNDNFNEKQLMLRKVSRVWLMVMMVMMVM